MDDYFRGNEIGIGTSIPAAKMAALFFERVVYPAPKHASPVPPEIIYPLSVEDVGQGNYLPFALMQEVRTGDIASWEWPAFFIHRALITKGIACVPVFTTDDSYKRISINANYTALEFTILRSPVIDVSNLEWKKIMELRKDGQAKEKLRRFRVMLHQDFEEKSPAFIQDDLANRLEDYETACKKHGLSLVTSVISELLSSQGVVAAAGMALAAVLTGTPGLAAVAAAPVSLEIGKAAIQIARHQIESEDARSNPIAWLADLKNN